MSGAKIKLSVALLSMFFILLSFTENTEVLRFEVPAGWPKPKHDFSRKPVTAAGFLLGNRLFYDPVLSKDSTVSCASCHLSFTAFTHADHRLSHGIYGRKGTRNASVLVNLAWSSNFMWDGAVHSLEQQPIQPLTSPTEMDNSMAAVVAHLNALPQYRAQFYHSFGDSTITSGRVLNALWQFTVMLVSYNSKYDSIMRSAPQVAFTPAEQQGYQLFKMHCASCHQEPLFTSNNFENNGLPVDTALHDTGRMRVTGNRRDAYKFKVPTLRNIAYSQPYFHDGRCNKLSEVIDHYTDGIVPGPTLAAVLRTKITFTREEKKALIAFLKTLSDKPFLYNRAFQYDFYSSK